MAKTGYLLLDEPNPHGPHFYDSRRGSVLACVVHITAGLQGAPSGVDRSAEQTARYAATTERKVSWHSGSDRDSSVLLLPDTYTAFQCQGYNSRTIGHEISKADISWADEDPTWVTRTLEMAAVSLRPRLKALGIPIRQATRAELDRAIAEGGGPVGLIGHAALDPTRRRDPGADSPWARFLKLLQTSPAPKPAPAPTPVKDDDMIGTIYTCTGRSTRYFTAGGVTKVDAAEVKILRARGVPVEAISSQTDFGVLVAIHERLMSTQAAPAAAPQ